MVEELREQVIQEDELDFEEEETHFAQSILNLKPAQRLLLAVLLFFNVAVCGCLLLVMLGRIMPPF